MPTSKPNTPADITAASNYRGYSIDSEFSFDAGYLILPLGDDSGGYVKVRIHGGLEKRKVVFNAAKTDTPPILPTGADVVGTKADGSTGTTYEFLGSSVSIPLPTPTPEGNGFDWTASGVYEYVAVEPHAPDGTRGYPLASPPYPTNSESVGLALGGVAGGAALAVFQTFPTVNPDSLSPVDFSTVYSYPFCQYLSKYFIKDGLIK